MKNMKNICIPNPTLYEIVYSDKKGEKSTRTIVPITQSSTAITAYCYSSHGIRTFNKSQIESITSTSWPD